MDRIDLFSTQGEGDVRMVLGEVPLTNMDVTDSQQNNNNYNNDSNNNNNRRKLLRFHLCHEHLPSPLHKSKEVGALNLNYQLSKS